jgi:hypothetical protein
MSSRIVQAFLVFVLSLTLLSVAQSAQACCGESPNYFFTVSVVGQPDCSYRGNTGRVAWSAQYHLPTNNTFVYSYGDGIIQGSDFYNDLPHTPGSTVDTYSSYTIWTWSSVHPSSASYKVRVEFWISLPSISSRVRALIVFDCTSRGAQNVTVHTGEVEPDL